MIATIVIAILGLVNVALLYLLRTKPNIQSQEQHQENNPQLYVSTVTHDRLTDMESRIDDLPNKVLASINGSISNQKGKLAELIAYVNLKAGYDKVIPLGNIVDFIGIRFPSDKDAGTFDFIDIKNGKSARLSEDQKQLQKLIKTNNIQFLKVKIITDNVADLPKDISSVSDSDPVI